MMPKAQYLRSTCFALPGLLFALLFAIVSPAQAIDRISLNLESLAADWGTTGPVVLHLDLLSLGQEIAVEMDIQGLKSPLIPKGVGSSVDLRLSCPAGLLDGTTFRCERLKIASKPTLPLLSVGEFSLKVNLQTAEAVLSAAHVAWAGGQADLHFRYTKSEWELDLKARGVDAVSVVDDMRRLDVSTAGFDVSAGTLDLDVAVDVATDSKQSVMRSRVGVKHKDLAFSDEEGLKAGEGVQGELKLRTTGGNGRWKGRIEHQMNAGQVYIDPVLVDADQTAVEFSADFDWNKEAWTLSGMRMQQGKALRVSADVQSNKGQMSANVDSVRLQFPQVFESWVQPFLIDAGLDELDTEGVVEASVLMGANGLDGLKAKFSDFFVEDRKGRFALYDLDGELAWDREKDTQSHLRWESGKLFALELGGSELRAESKAGEFAFTQGLHLAVLDGVFTLEDLRVSGLSNDEPLRASMNGFLSPISMNALSAAFEWPSMSGQFSGILPELHYEDGNVRVDGVLLAQVFDGVVRVRDFQLEDPFTPVPRMLADVEVQGLDLEQVTETFSFGSIEGTLDGEMRKLELLAWEPNRFDARFRSRVDDERDHRISRKAVSDLTNVAGGGGGGLFQAGGLLSLFDSFAYDEIGWQCRLRNGVCHMSGVANRDKGGYYIVRGAWLPRVDVVGHARRVDWNTLVERITNIRIEDLKIE